MVTNSFKVRCSFSSFINTLYVLAVILVECSAFQGIASTFEPGPADAISSFEPYPRPRGRALLCNSTKRGEQSAHSDLHGACTRSHALSLAERLLATLPRHASSVSATVSRVSRHFSNYESPVHKGLDFQFPARPPLFFTRRIFPHARLHGGSTVLFLRFTVGNAQ